MSKPSIRQATMADTAAIWEFVRRAYEIEEPGTSEYRIPERWIWQFQNNPFNRDKNDKLPIWLALVANRIVGQYCAIPTRVKIGPDVFDAAWGCDFIVDRDFRGHGLGYKLHSAFCEHYPVTLAITFADATRHLWEKSGGFPLASTNLYWYLVKVNRVFLYNWLGRYKNHPRFGKIVSVFRHSISCSMLAFFLDKANDLAKLLRSMSGRTWSREIQEVFQFDEKTDRIGVTDSEHFAIMTKRDAELMNWRVFANKQMGYRVFVSKKGGEVNGYIVLRKPQSAELSVGTIVDLHVAKDDLNTVRELINHSIDYFGDSVCAIQCLSSAEGITGILRSSGFLEMKRYVPLIVFSEKSMSESFKKMSNQDCHFSFIDHDIDKIRPV